ncbi:MAG: AsmA family protein [Rhodomicrobiaceae bacterium]
MGSLLAALATIIVTGLTALFALPYVVDWNDYKAEFESQAAKLVGRPVAIQGNIDLSILPVPTLSVRGLRISDEFGRFERPFAEVEEFNAVLSLPPLLRGTMEAKSIMLDQPIVRLKIDDFGEGTWLSLGPHGMTIPVPVQQVVLDRVDIRNGAIELRRADSPTARFDRISGHLSADSLSGPFRFDGVGAIGGGDKEIKLAAVRPKDDPNLRLKGSLRSLDGVSLYQLDGQIKGLHGPVHYEGPVAARLALDTKAKKAETGQLAEPMAGKAIELRASAKITLEDARLDDIALTVTQNDRPQQVTGWAHASWNDAPRLDLNVEASWLDIDQMLNAGADDEQRPVPTAAIAALPRIFEGWSFKPRQGQITAKIQQAGLSGDVVEGINFVASHNAGGWEIDTLVAHLPGDTDLDVKGTLPAGEALAFNGSFVLKGKNLSRLLRWSAPSLGVVDAGNAQNFGLSSGITLTPEQLAFRNAKGSLGDSSFTGDLVHDYGDNSKLLLALESDRLDLRTLYAARNRSADDPEGDALAQISPYKKTNDWSAETVPTRKTNLADVLGTVFKADQSNVSLLVSRLQLPDFEARDVRSAFRYEKGTFDFRELNLATTDGLKVEASGRITGFESKPNGSMKLSIDAPSAPSVTNLARLVGFDGVSRGARRRIEALSPFQLRGNFDAVAARNSVKLTLAGMAGGSELTFNGRMHGTFEELGNASIDINGGIGNADGSRLIAQLAPEVPLEKASAQKGAGYLNISALGTVKSGLVSKIELQTPQARGQFEGQIALLAEPSWKLTGDLTMRATQATTALSMLRMSPGGTPVTGAIDLQASISKEAAEYQVANLTLQIGGETVRGSFKADVSGDRPVADIDINAASVVLPKIAAYLVDWERDDLSSQIANVARGMTGVWPEQAFSLSALRAFDGTIRVKAPAFAIADGLTLKDGELKASLASGTLNVSELRGDVYGGTFAASGSLSALKGSAGFSGRLSLKNADLAALGKAHGGGKIVNGTGDLDLSFSGEGISPRGLITVMSGDGQLVLSKGSIFGLSPSVLTNAAETYLQEEIPDQNALAAKLRQDLRAGRLPYRKIAAPVVIKDGVLRVAEAEFRGDDYLARAGLIVDLGSLRFDSEWSVDPLGKTKDEQPLPPVRMVFAGPLSQFSSVSLQLNADNYERFLTMKRMDQDMEKLERLSQERGISRGAPPSRAAPEDRQPSDASPVNSSSVSNAQDGGENDIPSQSLLRAPDGALENRATPPETVASPPPPSAETQPLLRDDTAPPDTGVGWSAGVETTDTPATSQGDANSWQAEALQPPKVEVPVDFEAQIREVLRSQPGNNPAYQ